MRTLLHWIIDALWPHRCVACDRRGGLLCPACRSSLPRTPRVTEHPSEHVDRLVACSSFAVHPVSRAVWHLKYRNARGLADVLGCWMAESAGPVLGASRSTLIVPVPLHPARLRERGFNHAASLASVLARVSALPADMMALTRVRTTVSQVTAGTRDERMANVRNAFAASAGVRRRDVILIDDVTTTGATLEDCARAAREAGARRVTAVVLAHG